MGPKVENIVPCLGGGGVRCWLEGGSSSSVSPLSSAANRLIGEVVQSRRRPLLGPSPGLRHY